MTDQAIAINDRTFYAIADDLTAYTETLVMLEAERNDLPPEERSDIDRQIAEVKERIEHISGELSHKTDAIAAVLRRLGKEQEFIHEERDRLKAKEQACERAEAQLREYVLMVMRQNETTKLKTPTNTLFIRNTDAVEVIDAAQLDPHYLTAEIKLSLALWQAILQAVQDAAPQAVAANANLVRVRAEPALSIIRKAIKSGVNVEGADLRLNTHLVCR